MHDFDLIDKDFNATCFQSIVGAGTVIVSHAVDPIEELPYYLYLQNLGQRVVMVDSKESPLLHMMAIAYDLSVETYTDPTCNLVSKFKQQYNLSPDLKNLTRLLRFQILYVDGKEVGSWHMPVVDQWKHFIDDRDSVKRFCNQFGTYGVKWLREQDKDNHLLWTGFNQASYSRGISTPRPDFDFFFKYYTLMPNKQLEQKLYT
jgi:hypothetical protein|tara:strand:+ start:2541 stop:3149 length:609 start_codon:yes stop_codon:yes gene_type:complete